MEIEPAEILVTTGGQQVIDLVCKTLLDPGDVVIAEAPTYPGAVPVFGSYQADVVQIELDDNGMRVDLMEEALDRLDAEGRVPKFIYTVPVVPEPGRGDAVAGAAEAAGRGGAAARAARARGQPVRAAALRGRPAADAVLARRRRVRHLPRDVLEDPLPRAAAGLDRGAAAGAGEDEPRQGQRRPLPVVALAALRRRLLRRARLAPLRRHADRAVPAPARHDARRARRALPARGDLDAARGRAVHLGDAARLHRHHRPAGAGAAGGGRRVRPRAGRVPRRPRRLVDAPELLGRRRGRHPRGRAADRQGHLRAGRALRDADRGGAGQARAAARRDAPAPASSEPPNVLPLRRRAQ